MNPAISILIDDWPDAEWRPMSPDDARPKDMERIALAGVDWVKSKYVDEDEGFYLSMGWAFVPYKAYNMETGELVTPTWSLEYRTDCAECFLTVTMQNDGGETNLLKPTSTFAGTGE